MEKKFDQLKLQPRPAKCHTLIPTQTHTQNSI